MSDHQTRALGFWSACFVALLGIFYIAVLVYNFSTQGMAFPPPASVQLAGGIVTFLTAPALVVLFTAIRYSHPDRPAIYGSLGISFITLFAMAVMINRFVQLTVIQQAGGASAGGDLERFLPYNSGSVMFALEMLGWGFFSSLAALAVAPLFSLSTRRRWIRGLLFAYAILSLISVIGYATATPLTLTGFVAWGPVLTAITILLAVDFWRLNNEARG